MFVFCASSVLFRCSCLTACLFGTVLFGFLFSLSLVTLKPAFQGLARQCSPCNTSQVQGVRDRPFLHIAILIGRFRAAQTADPEVLELFPGLTWNPLRSCVARSISRAFCFACPSVPLMELAFIGIFSVKRTCRCADKDIRG